MVITYLAYVLTGLAAGFASALLGIGGGVILVPILMLLFVLPPKVATATSLVYITPVALYGALSLWLKGQEIKWTLALVAMPAGIFGAEVGAQLKKHISDTQLKVVFGLVMIVLGAHLALGPLLHRQPAQPVGPNPPAAETTGQAPSDKLP